MKNSRSSSTLRHLRPIPLLSVVSSSVVCGLAVRPRATLGLVFLCNGCNACRQSSLITDHDHPTKMS